MYAMTSFYRALIATLIILAGSLCLAMPSFAETREVRLTFEKGAIREGEGDPLGMDNTAVSRDTMGDQYGGEWLAYVYDMPSDGEADELCESGLFRNIDIVVPFEGGLLPVWEQVRVCAPTITILDDLGNHIDVVPIITKVDATTSRPARVSVEWRVEVSRDASQIIVLPFEIPGINVRFESEQVKLGPRKKSVKIPLMRHPLVKLHHRGRTCGDIVFTHRRKSVHIFDAFEAQTSSCMKQWSTRLGVDWYRVSYYGDFYLLVQPHRFSSRWDDSVEDFRLVIHPGIGLQFRNSLFDAGMLRTIGSGIWTIKRPLMMDHGIKPNFDIDTMNVGVKLRYWDELHLTTINKATKLR